MHALNKIELQEIENVELNDETKDRFKIENLDQLNWAFRKINALQGELKEKQQLADAEMQRIKEWLASESKPITDSIEFFEFLIQEYHQEQLKNNPKAKTLSTPYGKSKSRTSKAQPKLADKDAALKFVKENNLTNFIKEDLKWADFKKSLNVGMIDDHPMVIDENGQPVPGVEIEPPKITFKVEVE